MDRLRESSSDGKLVSRHPLESAESVQKYISYTYKSSVY